MKRTVSLIVVFAMLFSLCACNSFAGNLKTFFAEDSFYEDIGNVIFSIFAGKNSFLPLVSKDNISLKSDLELNNFSVNKEIVKNGSVKLDFSLLLTEELNYDYTIKAQAFDEIDVYKQCIQADNKMFIDYGTVLNNKPLCYYDEGYNCFSDALNTLKTYIEGASFTAGEEKYMLGGVEFKADTVSFALNSDITSKWINDLTNKLFSTNSTQNGIDNLKDNLVYSEWYYPMAEIANFVTNEKLHLKWTRYFVDDKISRESISLHDPNNHHITLDVAYAENDNTEYVEISIKAKDGGSDFDVFALSATKVNTEGEFTTEANILIGDEIKVTVRNSGDDKRASGSADFNIINTLGEQSFPINFEYTGERVGDKKNNGLGLKQNIEFSVSSLPVIGTDNIISFDGKINLFAETTEDLPRVEDVDKYYDLSTLQDVYYYHSVGQLNFDEAMEAITAYLAGDSSDYTTPAPVVDPYELDVEFDDGKSYETNGAIGKKYIDILSSDDYTFKYNYHSDERGYPLNYCAEYVANDKKMYTYDFATGTDYMEYHEGLTVYEVRHEINKTLYTEHDEYSYSVGYPKTEYIYDHSGYCNFDGEQYVYELYYDYYVNKYYLIFDKDDQLKIMLLESVVDQSKRCLFVEHLATGTKEDNFVLPDYEKVNMLDYIDENE